ncbi:MAG TPA: LysM peptidoglycan-binding domain-containing protein [Proteobacteria bacterium]|nr:LysM peptidoglycan-binding domain-containing protein [Pseudomonadota bacterium]
MTQEDSMRAFRLILFTVAGVMLAGVIVFIAVPARAANDGQVHVVQKGDTLWDISSEYLYDPFLWPRVWDANREIENPHLIYPGQLIAIPAEIETPGPTPRMAKPVLPPPPQPVVQETPAPAQKSGPEVKPAPNALPVAIQHEVIEALSTYGFIVDKDEIGLGTISSQEETHMLIVPGQTIFITPEKGQSLEKGKEYSLVRVFEQVFHPVTGRPVGYLARILGDVSVVNVGKKVDTAVVGDIYMEAQVGNHVMKHVQYRTWHRKNEPQPGKVLKGFILVSPQGKTLMGKGDVLFLDIGGDDGLGTGDILTVLDPRSRNSGRKKSAALSNTQESKGQVEVIIARKRTSLARIIQSDREIIPGDPVIFTPKQ